MQHRPLGKSDVLVSPVIFGAWAIGGWMWGGNDEQDSIDAIHASIDSGVNTIDTAAVYGQGHSEELVGRAIKGRRDKVIIATKCGMRWDDPKQEGTKAFETNENGKHYTFYKNAKPHSIVYECEQSLSRLGTDVIDLYQIHWPDLSTEPEDSWAAMEKLRKDGKVRAIGTSNYDVRWLERNERVAPVASNQPPYSLLNRGIEKNVLPFCRENGIGTICYSPMERGLLTGKVGPDREFGEGDHRRTHKFFTKENRQRVADALESIKPIADKHKASFAQLVINWTIHEPGITAALVGARNAEQAKQNAAAMNFVLSKEERAQIRKAFDEPSRVMTA
ncbi:MAG TPA: aldo/keto reductase [Tepidisphaeraceae bacterium]|jgi:aryl-alcohol dehydrogenase-like predicted oxidoreductase